MHTHLIFSLDIASTWLQHACVLSTEGMSHTRTTTHTSHAHAMFMSMTHTCDAMLTSLCFSLVTQTPTSSTCLAQTQRTSKAHIAVASILYSDCNIQHNNTRAKQSDQQHGTTATQHTYHNVNSSTSTRASTTSTTTHDH